MLSCDALKAFTTPFAAAARPAQQAAIRMDARSLQAFLPVEAPAQQTTSMAGSIPAPSLQGLSIAQQASLLYKLQCYTEGL
jgi:hypothetical protein